VVVGIATAVVLFIADQRSEARRDEATDDSGSA
jgi:hypothetical protein